MSGKSPVNNRRHFTRIPMDSEVSLHCGAQQWLCQLLDISLKGALLQTPDSFQSPAEIECRMHFSLNEIGASIVMSGTIMHHDKGQLGMRCDRIDLDSIGHLKRMVELNLGDESLLERELHELIATAKQ
jgi:hypothetical protein